MRRPLLGGRGAYDEAMDLLGSSHRELARSRHSLNTARNSPQLGTRRTRTAVSLSVTRLIVLEEVSDSADAYKSVTCIMCQRVHLVSRATGKVLGEKDK